MTQCPTCGWNNEWKEGPPLETYLDALGHVLHLGEAGGWTEGQSRSLRIVAHDVIRASGRRYMVMPK